MISKPSGMRGAALIQFASKYVAIFVQLGVTFVLARIIDPESFGIVAIVTVFVNLFNLVADFGVGPAIIQFRDLTENDYVCLFTFSLVLAFIMTAVFCVASFPISMLYGKSELVPLCCLASLVLFFGTLNMVPNGIMLKNKRFLEMGARVIASNLLSGILAVCLALLGFGAYALVLQSVFAAALVLAWNYAFCPIRGICFHFMESVKKIFNYSAYQFCFNLVSYFSRNLDNLLIGKFLGTTALGYYDKAYKLTTYPLSAFSGIIASVVQPFMAEHQDDRKAIYECWFRIEKILSLIGAIFSVIFICCSNELVLVLYGEQWIKSVPLFQALSISVYFQILGNPSGAFFQSLGRTDYMFKVGVINTSITVLFLIVGLLSGSLIFTSSMIACAFCLHMFALAYFLVVKGMNANISCLKAFLPEIVIALILSIALLIWNPFSALNPSTALCFKVVFIVATMLLLYKLTNQTQFLRQLVKH